VPPRSKPLVFISHSANGDKLASADLKAIQTHLKQQGFDVLLDRDRLKGGDQWRDCLHVWMAHCDAAILLLTKKALASVWVHKEATILAWRRSLDPTFVLLPVLAGDVNIGDVDSVGALRPSALPDTQALKGLRGAALAKALAERLKPLKTKTARTPLRILEEKIANILCNVKRRAILDATATALGVDLGGWNPQRDSEGMLALALLQATPAKLSQAIETLAGVLPQSELGNLVRMLSGVWINRALAGNFAVIAQGPHKERVAALNATRADFTPKCVLARASEAYPGWQGIVVTISGEDVVGSIVAQVRATLAQRNPTWTRVDLDAALAELGTKQPGVVVLEPTDPPVADAEIEKLVGRFESWTLLVLTGSNAMTVARRGVMKRIDPQLAPNEESDARTHFRTIEDLVGRSGATG
jgi:hypothetical protein